MTPDYGYIYIAIYISTCQTIRQPQTRRAWFPGTQTITGSTPTYTHLTKHKINLDTNIHKDLLMNWSAADHEIKV